MMDVMSFVVYIVLYPVLSSREGTIGIGRDEVLTLVVLSYSNKRKRFKAICDDVHA